MSIRFITPRAYNFKVKLTFKEVFPEVFLSCPEARRKRVEYSLQGLFTRCLTYMDNGLPFIITGDIPAMWLRDSTWQVKPLFHSQHPVIIDFLVNLSKTQVQLFLIDPYANAFNPKPNGNCWRKDFVDQSPWVFERKFELDSWASILYLSRKIYEIYGVRDHLNQEFIQAITQMLQLARKEQHHDSSTYVFYRPDQSAHDSMSHEGKGAPTGYTGMVYSAFRPSDDACRYNYHIPSNLFFANELRNLPIPSLQREAETLASEIFEGIETFGLKDDIYAYEVDGLGNALFMDDANVPSLLSLPYLEVVDTDDTIYQNTRAFILSENNPYYFKGLIAHGVGSQHTPTQHVWPIAIAIEGLTSEDSSLQLSSLDMLESTDAKTGSMHESFHVDDDAIFTREWFSWADMTYLDLVISAYESTS